MSVFTDALKQDKHKQSTFEDLLWQDLLYMYYKVKSPYKKLDSIHSVNIEKMIRAGYPTGHIEEPNIEFMGEYRPLAPVNVVDDAVLLIKYGAGKQIDRLRKDRKDDRMALELALYKYVLDIDEGYLLFIDKAYTRFGYMGKLITSYGIETYTKSEVEDIIDEKERVLKEHYDNNTVPAGCENKQWWKPRGAEKAVPMKCKTLCPYDKECFEFNSTDDLFKQFGVKTKYTRRKK
jgi:hypothetical protein